MNHKKRKSTDGKGLFSTVPKAIRSGSKATKLSLFFPGVGQLMRGQIVKGVGYLFLTVAFIAYLIFFGGRYLAAFTGKKRLFSVPLGRTFVFR